MFWRTVFFISIFSGITSGLAEARSLPTYHFTEESNPELMTSPAIKERAIKPTQFQVLVFPHLGIYNTPHGRETRISSVKITSSQGCTKYAATLNPSTSEWEKKGVPLSTAKEFNLVVTAAAYYFECEKGFNVIRAPLVSRSYKGNFVSRGKAGAVQVINLIDPEEYLKGVVPAEVERSWPLELLKSQAVAARTYAWWSVLKAREAGTIAYDMDDTIQYQAYVGITTDTEATDLAVEETKNLVLRHEGNIIKAYFSSDSGGHTESAVDTFKENLPYCLGKPEVYPDHAIAGSAWNASLSLSAISSKLAAQKLLPAGIKIQKVSALVKNPSGRVNELKLLATNGKTYSVFGPKFRLALKLRSTKFTVSSEAGVITFNGMGYGHGVGMSQKGAHYYVSAMGWTFDQVLRFYYSDTVLSF